MRKIPEILALVNNGQMAECTNEELLQLRDKTVKLNHAAAKFGDVFQSTFDQTSEIWCKVAPECLARGIF